MLKSTIVSTQLKHVPLEMTSKASTVVPFSMNWRQNTQLSLSACRFQMAVNWQPMRKITQWSAKYFNGSNIQGTGARYVLQDNATNQYFSLKAGQTFLPKQMTEITATGFRRVGDKVQYFSTSGYLAKNTFIQVGANQWYYLIRTATWSQVNRSLMARNTSS